MCYSNLVSLKFIDMKNRSTSSQDSCFNEILFENRNKNYGAYVLRTEEGKTLTQSLFIGLAFFAAISITPLMIGAFTSKDVIATPEIPGHVLSPVDPPITVPPVATPVSPPKSPEAAVSLEVPTPTLNPPIETPPASVNQIKDSNIGTENVVGEPAMQSYTPPVKSSNSATPPVTVPPKPVNNDPVSVVDVQAGFLGGIDTFRSKVVQNFGTDHFEGAGELMKTTVTFIVEKDGTISNIKANGKDSQFNAEAERTIKKIKGKWSPAKLNGENVRSYFKFPISMQFE